MQDFPRRKLLLAAAATTAVAAVEGLITKTAIAADTIVQVYKSPWCGCCGAWVSHLRKAGFQVEVIEADDLNPIKRRYRVPEALHSCHTAVVDGYVIEGHVPAREVKRLIKERPAAVGLSVPGMPIGSPGMEQGGRRDPYRVILFTRSEAYIYQTY